MGTWIEKKSHPVELSVESPPSSQLNAEISYGDLDDLPLDECLGNTSVDIDQGIPKSFIECCPLFQQGMW